MEVREPIMPFMALPKELRLDIYDCIAKSITERTLPSITLRDYQGLLLSSKQTYLEFESHYVKAFNRDNNQIYRSWPLERKIKISTPTKLHETNHVRIHFPDIGDFRESPDLFKGMVQFVTALVDCFHSCALLPDDAVFKTRDEQLNCSKLLRKMIDTCVAHQGNEFLQNVCQWAWLPQCLFLVSPKSRLRERRVRACQLYLWMNDKEQVWWEPV